MRSAQGWRRRRRGGRRRQAAFPLAPCGEGGFAKRRRVRGSLRGYRPLFLKQTPHPSPHFVRCHLLAQGEKEGQHGCPAGPWLVPTPPMADKPKKPQKLKARLPRGLEDRGPAAIAATRQMVEKIREVYERYGFEPVETPAMEFTDALGKFLPDQDRPERGRVLVPGRRRAVDLAALRSDRAAGALCRGKFRLHCQSPIAATAPATSIATKSPAPAASASSCSSTPTRWAQRHAGGRCRDVHDGGGHDGSARHSPRPATW